MRSWRRKLNSSLALVIIAVFISATGGVTIRSVPLRLGTFVPFWPLTGLSVLPWAEDAGQFDPARLVLPLRPDGKPANYLHTNGNRLYDAYGRRVEITGINWFGMETGTFAPHGLWTRNWKSMLDQIVDLGYNTIRLPYSNELLTTSTPPQSINYYANPDLEGLSGLQVMDTIIKGAGERGLRVILDRHRPDSSGQSDLWYTDTVSEEQWISDWQMLAARYFGDDTVIGVDLHDEPRGAATWGTGDIATDWRLASERAANAILEVNPYLLILVQGVETYDGEWYWWGGNLKGVGSYPVRLSVPGRVIYSPHDYGPGVYWQGWFNDPTFPRNLPSIWDDHWGYIHRQAIAPVMLSEFGGRSVGLDLEGEWQRALIDFIRIHGVGYTTWSLNPNSGDTGGLLEDDWLTVVQARQNLYSSYLAPFIPDSSGLTADVLAKYRKEHNQISVLYRTNISVDNTRTISFALQFSNNGPTAVPLSSLEARYWFTAENMAKTHPEYNIDWAAFGQENVKGKFVQQGKDGNLYYLSLTFDNQAGNIDAYSSSGGMLARIHKADWSEFTQSNDYSFAPFLDFQQTDKVTLYSNGKLIWGTEPKQ